MVEMGKECGFPSNFDMLGRLPRVNGVTAQNRVLGSQIAERPHVSQSRGRATNSVWGRD